MLESLPPWWKGSCGILKKSYDVNGLPKPSSWRSVHRGRSMVCEGGNDYSQSPVGSRGRGPWSGRGSQRVKPRLVSPFEKRRLSPKGQKFLRVVCPKAGFCLSRQQRFRVGDPSNRPAGSVGMTVIWNRRDSSVAAAAGSCLVCHPERVERAEGSPC